MIPAAEEKREQSLTYWDKPEELWQDYHSAATYTHPAGKLEIRIPNTANAQKIYEFARSNTQNVCLIWQFFSTYLHW